MSADPSAYRLLGLEPGADAAAVEAAYRTLIKRYHPDRQGGDSGRAAEINWAYHQIRAERRLPQVRRTGYPVVQPPASPAQAPRRRRRLGLALAAAVAVAVALEGGAVEQAIGGIGVPPVQTVALDGSAAAGNSRHDPAEPLDSDAIDRAVQNAVQLARNGGVDRLASQSRRCHAELRRAPDISRLDQCVAFDEAAVTLIAEQPLDGATQFSPSAVTGRQLSSARLVSSDYMTVESRLDRIRSRVAFALAPPDPQPVPPLEF